MFQHLRGIVFIAAVMLNFVGAVFAAEKDYDSANAMMPVCREAIKTTNAKNDPLRFLMQGNCMGIVAALHYFNKQLGLCMPNAVTNGQAIRVVLKYIDDRPARTHENFMALAFEALQAAWPCPK
jgi:Ssp1 endopeptidase immunity protein Rap1a